MNFEWDAVKATANLKKHGVDFADATAVFFDEQAITLPDGCRDEERYVTIGLDSMGRCVVAAYTWRFGSIRLISARKATRSEARLYSARDR